MKPGSTRTLLLTGLLVMGGQSSLLAQYVANNQFSNPVVPSAFERDGLQPTAQASGWTFSGAAELHTIPNPYNWWTITAPPRASQVCRLGSITLPAQGEKQVTGPVLGKVSQVIYNFSGDTQYKLVLDATRTWSTRQYISATIDSTTITWNGNGSSAFQPAYSNWNTYTSDAFRVSTGRHTLTISAANSAGDIADSCFVTNIALDYNPIAGPRNLDSLLTFSETGQSFWGAGKTSVEASYLLGSSWGSKSSPVSGSGGGFWNPSTPSVDCGLFTIPGISLGETGFSASASTYGNNCGLLFDAVATGGNIDVNYPAHIHISYPANATPGQTLTVQTSWNADATSSIDTKSPIAYASVTGQLDAGFKVNAKGKAFGETLFDGQVFDLAPSFSKQLFNTRVLLRNKSYPGSKEDSANGAVADSIPSKVNPILTVKTQIPYVHLTGSPGAANDYKRSGSESLFGSPVSLSYLKLDPPQAALTDPNASYARDMDTLVSVKGSITNLALSLLGLPGLNQEWEKQFGGVTLKAKVTLLDLYALLDASLLQEATFVPAPQITLTTDDGQSATAAVGDSLVLKMPANGKPLNISSQVNMNNSFTGSTYLALTGGIQFDPISLEFRAKAGIPLGSFEFSPVPTFGVKATVPVPLYSNTFEIPFDLQKGETFQVPTPGLPTATRFTAELADGAYLGQASDSLYPAVDGLYYWPTGTHASAFPAGSPYATAQPTYVIHVQGDRGPLPGAPGGIKGATRLTWDKGTPAEADITTSAQDATGIIKSNLVTPGVHDITVVSTSGTDTQKSTISVECRAFQPMLDSLTVPTKGQPAALTTLTAGALDTPLLLNGNWFYASATKAFLDGQELPLQPVASPTLPLQYLSPGKQSPWFVVTLPQYSLADGAVHTFKLVTTGPGGGTSLNWNGSQYVSTPITFTVRNPRPEVTSIETTVTRGQKGQQITVQGSGFVPSTAAYINQVKSIVTYTSPNRLYISLPDSLRNSSSLTLHLKNPYADAKGNNLGGGDVTNIPISIVNPAPKVETVQIWTPFYKSLTEPTSFLYKSVSGYSELILNAPANGPSFISGYSSVTINGEERTQSTYVPFVPGQQLIAQLKPKDVANTGTLTVTVSSPAPGGGSVPLTMQVIYPTPEITGVSDVTASSTYLDINGGGFADSKVILNGTTFTNLTVYPGGQKIRVQLPANLFASKQVVTVQVVNPTSYTFPNRPVGKQQTDGGPSMAYQFTVK